jgi:hypothetical protein
LHVVYIGHEDEQTSSAFAQHRVPDLRVGKVRRRRASLVAGQLKIP